MRMFNEGENSKYIQTGMHAIKNIYGNAECMYNGANKEVNVNFAVEATQTKRNVV